MTRAQMTEDLRKAFGKSYLSIADVARYMGSNRDQAKHYLVGVTYIETGERCKGKRYHIRDVADMLFRRQVRE